MKNALLYIVTMNLIVWFIIFSVNMGPAVAETGAAAAVSGGDGALASVSGGNAGETAEQGVSPKDSDLTPIISLQVPDHLDFVIDPWNLAGHGQIYSERFTIKNTGDTACAISLRDITCWGIGGAVVVDSTQEIYAQDVAAVYLELRLESGECLILSREQSEYSTVLLPGGELVFWLTGAVNEKTSEPWAGKGLSVSLKYSVLSV